MVIMLTLINLIQLLLATRACILGGNCDIPTVSGYTNKEQTMPIG